MTRDVFPIRRRLAKEKSAPRLQHPPRRLRFAFLKRGVLIAVAIFFLVIAAACIALWIDWTWKRPLRPRGGSYFFHRLELPVPQFRQGDEKWRDDALGGVAENGTVGGEG